MAVYRGFDQATLDREYSPSSRVADMGVYLREYASASLAARRALAFREYRYGPLDCERLDFFPAGRARAPLVVFVHGGYWQELDKSDSSFPATGFLSAGAAFAAIGYGLAPAFSLPEIVDQVRRALRWLLAHAGELGVDRIHLVGHCAGAQLVLAALLADEALAAVSGVTALSGVYDLEPVRLSYVNGPLGLDRRTAAELSPIRQLCRPLPPLLVAVGGIETAEFARQHEEFVLAARRWAPVRDLVLPARNHFDIPFDLADPASPLGAAQSRALGLQ
ncbi:alpha/beta hydrolase [Kutzneria albida]|uniref:alpha/beta hydrolase n=1 Tax=Kutzneria albida TaxID=43357 RepID=UPI0004AEE779|nr:alpha/beta hydrolase [Kutzneria albida]